MSPMRELSDRALAVRHQSFEFSDFEIRNDGPTGLTFEGVASIVDQPYTVRDMLGEYQETIRAGAFNKTLKDGKADVGLFVNHNWQLGALPLATRMDGSLQLKADPHLRVVAHWDPSRPSVQEARSAVQGGQARQMSIGFSAPKSRQTWNADYTERQVHELNLGEVSIVWKGANTLTSTSVRSLDLLLSADMSDWSEEEIRSAIERLTALLPAPAEEIRETVIEAVEATKNDEENEARARLLALWDARRTPVLP